MGRKKGRIKMNIEEKISWLERELKELKKEIQKEENENNGVWKPKAHEMCYSIDEAGNICEWYWLNSREDDGASLAIGNVFRTGEEAEFIVERLKVIQELKQYARPFRDNETNYYICFNQAHKKVEICPAMTFQRSDLYFKSGEIAKQALEEVGEDRVKKYYLKVEE